MEDFKKGRKEQALKPVIWPSDGSPPVKDASKVGLQSPNRTGFILLTSTRCHAAVKHRQEVFLFKQTESHPRKVGRMNQ